MKRRLSLLLAIALAVGLLNVGLPGKLANVAYADPAPAASIKIPLSRMMVVNESLYGDPTALADQQGVAGDPRGGTGGGADSSFWYGAWSESNITQNYPAYAYIDLGQSYAVTDIYLRKRDKSGEFAAYAGSPGNWSQTELFADPLTAGNWSWIAHSVTNVETRYLRFKMSDFNAQVSEIVVYGVPISAKIALSPAMVKNETGYGNATRLVDEQTAAGDPKNGAGGAPGTFWFGAWEDPHNPLNTTYPIYAYLDLGREYYLTDVYLYDFNDGGAWDNYDAAFNVYTGSPGNWTAAFNAMHTYSNTWKSASLDSVKTRYVRVEMSQLAAIMSELVLYGSPAEAPLPPKIGLNISMVTGATDAYKLVDDQAAVGDPLHSPVSVNWGQLHGWNDWNGNAYIDLGQPFDVASIWLGDYLGSGGVKVYAGSGSPIAWTQLFTSGLNGYESWSKYNTSVTTQHIRVEKTGGGDMPEIVMYGTPVAKPILLMDTMATNVSGFDDVSKLVNQQAQAGDPLRGIGVQTGDANAVIAANVPTSSYPAEAVIDLGSLYDLTNVGLLDGSDMAASVTGAVYVYTGSPGNWGQPIAVDQMKNYGGWNMHPIKTTAQYVRIVKNSSNANLSEIVLYGTRVGGAIADAIPPAAVSNLAATAIGSNSATLRWIAPGDSGTAGTAASYEIRYGTSPITEGNWSAATLVAGAPAPLAAGSQQTMNVGGLTEETTYYFALKTTDGVGNVSGLSNVMTLTTAAVDIIAPAAVTNVSAVFLSGNAAKLTWTATGDDGATGAAASYEIRYSTSPITSGNWSAASAASFVPSPKAAGQAMSAWVNGLAAETAYYFAVGAKDEADNASALSNVASATTLTHDAGSKLELTADMIVNEGAHGDATKLVDQQAAAGSPRDGTGGQLNVDDSTVRWDLGTNNIYLPASAVIDLGVETEITDIYVYDGNGGNGLLTLSAGDPFNWQPLATDTLVNWKQWNRHQVNATTRYLQVKRATNADLTEIVVYGTPLGTPEAKPQPVAHVRPKMDELIGINAFIDDPMERMAVAGFIREYHNWNWDEGDLWNWGQLQTGYSGYPNNTNKFNPSYAGGGWNFDAYYDMLHDAGITVAPSIKESVGWLSNKANFKPISEGESATDPASYAEHSDHLFQFAARYGSTTVADNLLKLAEDQEELSGLGTLQYYENWNEHDKWWEGREGYFNPYEYAAMTSADYDGDQGRMGNTFGVKNADPNAKLVMSGLADPQLEYVRALKFWSEWNRGGSVPFDVINIHHYSNNGTDQQSGTAGISPEADNFLGKLKKFVDYRDQYMPGKEVWITEFGYDTNQQSPQKAPIIGSKSAEEVQGEWLVRSYLAASAAGVDKAAMYMLRDVDAASATRFDSSGLTGSKNTNWAPKISWYYVYTLKNQLAGMRYASELDSGNDDVKIYKYGNDSNSKDVYVLWAPTSDDTEVADYELTLSDSGTSVKLVTMTEGDTDGVESALTATGGKVTVDVNERPIYVVVNKGTVTPDPNHAPIISSPANGTTVSKTEGENVALTVSATDEDDDTLAYSVSGLPNGANYTMNAGTGAFTWTAPAVGTHTLTFTASDGEDDGTDSVTITVTVTAATLPNHAPIISSPANGTTVSKTEGENVALTVSATDEDDDTLAYSVSGLPNGANYTMNAGTGAFTWTAPAVGTHTLTFTASDGEDDGTDSVTITVTVTAATLPNHAPIISSPANGTTVSKTEGENVALTVSATDEDDDTLAYSVSGLPNGANYTMNAGTGAFTWTAPAVGTHTLTFTASDGEDDGTDSVTITVTVTAATLPNHAPIISSPANGTTVSKTEGENVALTVSATDEDDDTLAYSVSGLPNGANYTMNAGTGAFSWTAPAVGTHTLTFTASDGEDDGTDSVTITVTVTAATQNPDQSGTVVVIPQEQRPVVITGGGIEVNIKPNNQGQASLELSSNEVKQAVANATGELKINVVGSDGADSVRLALPAKELAQHGSGAFALTIDTGLAAVTVPATTLANVIGDSDAKLELTVSRIEGSRLPEEAKQQVGRHPVFDLTITLGGVKVSRFGNNGESVEVRIPYQPTPNEEAHAIIVYYIADDGTLTVVNNGKYDATTGTVTFHTNHFSQYAVAYVPVSFEDLVGSQWAKQAIEALAARGIVKGFEEGEFRPQGNVTRAEYLTMLIGVLDSVQSARTNTDAAFTDVAPGAWYAEVVNIASELGIAKGRGDGTFGPNDRITRAEMAILLARTLKLSGAGSSATFADIASLSSEAREAITNAVAAGLLEGFSNGYFKPGATATRAQAAVVIYRVLNR